MTLNDEVKILDDKIIANQAQYHLGRETAKISALSSKDLLEKYEYLTGGNLGHRPSVLDKTKFDYSPLGMSLSKSFKNDNVKNIANSESGFNYDSNYKFYKFYNRRDQFEDMSLDSKYNWIKEFNNLRIKLKLLNQKKNRNTTQKERIMKNFDELYEKYYNAYGNDCDADELSKAKKKKFGYKFDKTDKNLRLEKETKKFFNEIKNKEKIVDKKKFREFFSYEPTALVNSLLSQSTQDLRKSFEKIKQ